MVDTLAYFAFRAFIFAVNFLPLTVRVPIVALLIRFIALFLYRYKQIAHKNLRLAFPEMDYRWRQNIIIKSYTSLARVIVDFARLHKLTEKWVRSHVECPLLSRFEDVKRKRPGKGVLIATGHLGSFELLGYCMSLFGHPLSFVVRDFKFKKFDRWWRAIRESNGNKAISRKGAFKEIISCLNDGLDVAILFDQNIRRSHAVFVEWFGRPAATTKAFAMAAIRTEAPVFVASMEYLKDDHYRINANECDFTTLYKDESLSTDEKILIITKTITQHYEAMIRNNPEAWFWMHRRWKTTPVGMDEEFYD